MADPEKNASSHIVEEISEVVGAANLKVTGEQPAVYQNMTHANAVAHQQAMNNIQQNQSMQLLQISNAIVAKASEMIINTSPSEGATDIVAMMQLVKAGVLTPPVQG